MNNLPESKSSANFISMISAEAVLSTAKLCNLGIFDFHTIVYKQSGF